MPEKFLDKNPKKPLLSPDEIFECANLLTRAATNIETLSIQERKRLVGFGYYYLETEKNAYKTIRVFTAIQNFEGLRRVADWLLQERPDSYDLLIVLTLLEDHEGIRSLLNRKDIKFPKSAYKEAFYSLTEPLYEHIKNFLSENKTPIATGTINEGIDLVAIYNLAREYDIAVPIARGGLNQGAIANLWDVPTRIIEIAAHKRKAPRSKWLNPVSTEDFNGKRVLLFDKDAVSGATVRRAVNILRQFQPASIGIYFAHPVLHPESISIKIGTIISGLPEGIEIYSPNNAPMEKAGDAYLKAHEKLKTPYGRRRQIERLFTDEAQRLQEQFPGLAEALKTFATNQCRIFDSLNPNLAGISEVREQILLIMNQLYKDHQEYLKNKMYDLPNVAENFERILKNHQLLPQGFESELIRARYRKWGDELARRRNVENPHYPKNPLAAFNAAQKAVKNGFDAALIVGPEGFAYEPYFHDLGLSTVAVNIPEGQEGGPRSIKLFDDLSVLKGKKVLVVEDDVRTGATLQKLLEYLEPHNPKCLELYLGTPKRFQKLKNIPPKFENVYLAEDSETASREFIEYLESRGLKIFKTTEAKNRVKTNYQAV